MAEGLGKVKIYSFSSEGVVDRHPGVVTDRFDMVWLCLEYYFSFFASTCVTQNITSLWCRNKNDLVKSWQTLSNQIIIHIPQDKQERWEKRISWKHAKLKRWRATYSTFLNKRMKTVLYTWGNRDNQRKRQKQIYHSKMMRREDTQKKKTRKKGIWKRLCVS